MKTIKRNINNGKKNTKKNKGKMYLLKGGDNNKQEDKQEIDLKERVAKERDAAIKSCGNNNGWCVEQMEARYKDPGKEGCNWTTGEGNCDGNYGPLLQFFYPITFRPMGYGIYWIVHKIAGFSIFSLAGFMEGVQTAYKIASENMEKKFTKIGDATKGAFSSLQNLTRSNNRYNPNMTGGRKTRRRKLNKTK